MRRTRVSRSCRRIALQAKQRGTAKTSGPTRMIAMVTRPTTSLERRVIAGCAVVQVCVPPCKDNAGDGGIGLRGTDGHHSSYSVKARSPTTSTPVPRASSWPTPTPRIAELPDTSAQTVTVRGWVTHVRSSGKVAFAVIRDGTGVLQAVFVKTQLAAGGLGAFRRAHAETSVAGHRRSARRAARAGRIRDRRDGPHRSSARARSTIRSSRRSTGSTSCSTTGTSGCAAIAQRAIFVDPERDRAGDPRFLLRARLPARRHADPHRGDRRAERTVRDRVLRRGERVPRADRPALWRGGGGGVREDLHLRPDVPRREVEDAPPPHRVLDDRAGGGVERLRRQHAAAGGLRLVSRAARASSVAPPSSRSSSATSRSSSSVKPPFHRARTTRTPSRSCRRKGSDDQVGRRSRRGRRSAASWRTTTGRCS